MKNIIRILTIALVLSIFFGSVAFAVPFKEVDLSQINEPNNWAKKEVKEAEEAGLLTKNTNNYFKADITRSQFAELVVNMVEKAKREEISPADVNTFTDTADTSILKAYKAGIVNGVSKTEFAPNDYITREQIAAMLYRSITYIESNTGKVYTTKTYNIEKYQDSMDISQYAVESVGILANNGIMQGTSETQLSPKGSATIEQSILLVYRIFNIVTK